MSYVQSMAKKILYLNCISRCHWLVCLVHNVSSDVNVSCLGVSPYRQPAVVLDMDSWTPFAPEPKLSRVCPGPGLSSVRRGWVFSPPGSCSVDFHDMVVGGGQHKNLPCVAVVEHLSGAEGLQTRHCHALLLLVAAAHRVHAPTAADTCRVRLVIQRLVQQGQAVVLHAAVCGWRQTITLLSILRMKKINKSAEVLV